MSSVGNSARRFLHRAAETPLLREDPTRAAWVVLGLACAAYLGLTFWTTRGVSFDHDEVRYFVESAGFSPAEILHPYNGHLIAGTRFIYASSLELFGSSYVPIKALMAASVIACAVLLFALLRRVIGDLLALTAAILVLFLGSSTVQVVGSNAVFPQACAFGLLAWLMLDGPSSRGRDATAFLALCLSILSLEVGIAFALGAAAWIAIDTSQPLRRLWVPALPLLGYAAWYLWARQFGESLAVPSNVLLTAQWGADSLAAAIASLSGLGAGLVGDGPPAGRIAAAWGYPLAALFVALFVWSLRAGRLRPAVAAPLALMLSLWGAGALNFGLLRTPFEARYVFPIVLGVLLIAAHCVRGVRLSRLATSAILLAAALSLVGNLWSFREEAREVRADSLPTQARLAMVDLQRDEADPDLSLGFSVASVTAGEYLAASATHGPIGLAPAEVPEQEPIVRQRADLMLAAILNPELEPIGGRSRDRECGAVAESGASLPLPAGGAVVHSPEGGAVLLGRFGDQASLEAGTLRPGAAGALHLPSDDLTAVPWFVAAATPGQTIRICDLPAR